MRIAALCALALLGGVAQAAPDEEYGWYKNEMRCGEARVLVHSYCAQSDHTGQVSKSNTLCTSQMLTIERPGRKPILRDLHARRFREHLIARQVTCTRSSGDYYLYMSLDNGGNCDTCEAQDILGLDGRWRMVRNRWLIHGDEKRRITQDLPAWVKQEGLWLNNMVPDPQFDH